MLTGDFGFENVLLKTICDRSKEPEYPTPELVTPWEEQDLTACEVKTSNAESVLSVMIYLAYDIVVTNSKVDVWSPNGVRIPMLIMVEEGVKIVRQWIPKSFVIVM